MSFTPYPFQAIPALIAISVCVHVTAMGWLLSACNMQSLQLKQFRLAV